MCYTGSMKKENYNQYMKVYMREYSAKRRLKALELLGGQCVKCESKDGLQIHHKDPSKKSFTLASGWHHAWAKIEEELSKCEILCNSCHIKHHTSSHSHGDVRRYWQGCRCRPCKSANTTHNRTYRESRKTKFDS